MLQLSDHGPLPELSSLSTGDYLESWLSQVRGRVRGRTYQGYAGLLRRYAMPTLGEIREASPEELLRLQVIASVAIADELTEVVEQLKQLAELE